MSTNSQPEVRYSQKPVSARVQHSVMQNQHYADQPAEIASNDPGSSITLVHLKIFRLPISLY